MAEKATFRVYGENGATFLVFQALADCPDAVQDVLIARLKQFGTRGKWDGPRLRDVEVWLFPNFGKASGFGEPDVVIVAQDENGDDYAIWIEVETTINSQRALPSLRRSLVQLWRFRFFQHALIRRSKREAGALRINGVTLSDEREVRGASLLRRDHGVLQVIGSRLQRAGEQEHDHYVLFTIDRPHGEGKKRSKHPYWKVLERETDLMSSAYPAKLPRLPLDRCWYAYWYKDIRQPYRGLCGQELDLVHQYVRIKRK